MFDELTGSIPASILPAEADEIGKINDLNEKSPQQLWQDRRITQVEELLALYQTGQMEQGEKLLREMSGAGDAFDLFREIGRLTRELHDNIHAVLEDERLFKLAHKEIPDVTERLKHVIEMTEQAANNTLSAVEAGLPKIEHLRGQIHQLQSDWQRFRLRQMTFEEFRILVPCLSEFLKSAESDAQEIGRCMTDIMMAQDFQDLTGQIIRRVIGLVQDVEVKLVQIIRVSGAKIPEIQFFATESPIQAMGPATPSVDQNAVACQDDVDDLLSSLGF
ncbi:MAG: protein phosphatase CheZ [Pseudomonadota bacterium]